MHFADTTTSVNFEVVFSENQSSFDVIYGATSDSGLDETSGVQASETGPATTFSCGTATLTNGLKVTYMCREGQSDANALPSATCTPSSFHIASFPPGNADSDGVPSQLQSEILAEPNVTSVDLFDATSGYAHSGSASGIPDRCAFQQFSILRRGYAG